jgi:hypothetical protein
MRPASAATKAVQFRFVELARHRALGVTDPTVCGWIVAIDLAVSVRIAGRVTFPGEFGWA